MQEQIDSFLNYLTVECGLAENTIIAYHRDINRFRKYLENQKLGDYRSLSTEDVSLFVPAIQKKGKLSATSAARALVSVRMFYNFLQFEGVIKKNPAEPLTFPRIWHKIPTTLSRREVEALLEAVSRQPEKGPENKLLTRNRAIIELLYATGMRVSEVCDLELGAVNFDYGF